MAPIGPESSPTSRGNGKLTMTLQELESVLCEVPQDLGSLRKLCKFCVDSETAEVYYSELYDLIRNFVLSRYYLLCPVVSYWNIIFLTIA